ncbi:hypothetical protein KC19_6G087800 [Ceratodon purpureus]|uniref:Uncharacterized protein n=1 Tax=Ceratodon purpureus TaxID=3225 RepID=A0A8T0HFJ6_CERPU|nr:hypothetical protein KC19_6G087800 [Ceratodon purpureus]
MQCTGIVGEARRSVIMLLVRGYILRLLRACSLEVELWRRILLKGSDYLELYQSGCYNQLIGLESFSQWPRLSESLRKFLSRRFEINVCAFLYRILSILYTKYQVRCGGRT